MLKAMKIYIFLFYFDLMDVMLFSTVFHFHYGHRFILLDLDNWPSTKP